MVSKNQIKLINSLQQKKYRFEHQLFIAEGVKVIQELLQSKIVLEHLFATEESFSSFLFYYFFMPDHFQKRLSQSVNITGANC